MSRIHDKIRETIETTPGLTQRGLAERMGLNPAAVNRMLYGQRQIKATEIPVIEAYIGVKLDLEYGQRPASQRGLGENTGVSYYDSVRVPVYGYAAGSADVGRQGSGLNLANGEVIDWVQRHPAQMGVQNAFAIYVFSDSMEPRYFRGELIYVHPGRPADVNRDCVIQMKNGDAYIKRLVRQQGGKIRVQQFNPPEEKDISLKDVQTIYAVIGRG
jgi:phage repressor protein C with HTH and peptisase S24 domain